MIYLDNAATTRVSTAADYAVQKAHSEFFLNPSALYKNAGAVRAQIAAARKTVADFLCAEPDEIYFTSGATEANNWAVFSGVKKKNLMAVTSAGEHASVYESFTALRARDIETRFASLNADTSVNIENFLESAGQNCGFASLIHVSNETGAVNDIESIFRAVKKRNPDAVLHSDGVQAFGKIETDVKKCGVDLYSVSGHKVGAPKGIGALYIRKGFHTRPLLYGGGQERGLRAGTENVPGILAFAAAVKQYAADYRRRESDFATARERFFNILSAQAGDIRLNGKALNASENAHNILSMSVIGLKSEVLQRILADRDDILIGLGSACAASKRGNRILQAAGKNAREIEGNIRISFGIDTTAEEAEAAARIIAYRINELRGKPVI